MRTHVSRAHLADTCRRLRLPFDGAMAGKQVAIGCPFCWPFNRDQLVILTLDEAGGWLGQCKGCERFCFELFDVMKLELLAQRIEVLA